MNQTELMITITLVISSLSLMLALLNLRHIQINSGFSLSKRKKKKQWENSNKKFFIANFIDAAKALSDTKTGAIITFERNDLLKNWIDLGHKLNSEVSAEILISIFNKHAPTHDGAVIISGSKIACCSTYFPMSQEKLPIKYGSRHRASIQISNLTDSLSVVVSEETGNVSVAISGKLKEVTFPELSKLLEKEI